MSAEPSTKSIIPLGERGLKLTSFDELYRFSQFVVKAGFFPRDIDTAEKVFLALQNGLELGLTPMAALQNSMVVNNRVTLFGELVEGMVRAHPEFVDMKVEYSGDGEEYKCAVTIERKGQTPRVGEFSIADARKAELLTDPRKKDTWQKYTKDMLFWRAFSRAKRIFSDRLKGVVMPHEAEEAAAGAGFDNARNVTPEPAKPEINKEARGQRAKDEIKKAREEAERAATAAETAPATNNQAAKQNDQAAANGKNEAPAEPPIFEAIRKKLSESNIPEDLFLKVLERYYPIDARAGLKGLPAHVLENTLTDFDEVVRLAQAAKK